MYQSITLRLLEEQAGKMKSLIIIHYSGSHKTKVTARALLGEATRQQGEGGDARNRGVISCVAFIKGSVTIATPVVTLVARSYIRKNGGEVPGQDAVRAS